MGDCKWENKTTRLRHEPHPLRGALAAHPSPHGDGAPSDAVAAYLAAAKFVNDDGLAISYQTMGQYRAALASRLLGCAAAAERRGTR